MSRFLNEYYRELNPYVPGEQPQDKTYIKLNTNESPFPPAFSLKQDLNAEFRELTDGLRFYSDPELTELKEAIAEYYKLTTEEVFVGNGSDECLYYAFITFCNNGISFPDITYGFYKVYAGVNHIKANIIPLKEDFSINAKEYRGLETAVILANPNAPTGFILSLEEIKGILETNKNNIVIIDEAYIDFADEGSSAVELINEYENLLVIQTFSKSRSLAGARIGFAMGNKELISDLERIRFSINPYNVNTVSMKMAVEGIKNVWYFKENCEKIKSNRSFTQEELVRLGFEVIGSKTNFLFARTDGISGGELYERLKENGILVRHFNEDRIRDYNRITIGSREDMERFIEATRTILGK